MLVSNWATGNEVSQPEGVHGGELIDLVRRLEPLLPVVVVSVVLHSSHALKVVRQQNVTYLREVLEGGKCNHVPIVVQHGDCQVCWFDEFQDPGVRVNSVVDVILSDLDQLDDLVAVVGVSTSEDETFEVGLFLLVLLNSFKVSVHTDKFVCFSIFLPIYMWWYTLKLQG